MAIDRRQLQNFDLKLLLLVLGLCVFGATMVYSATNLASGSYYATRQGWWIFLGLGAFLAATALDYRILIKNSLPFYLANLVLLLVVYLTGRTVGGAASWFHLGPASLQPSEFAKVTTMLFLSEYLSRQQGEIDSVLSLIIPLAITAIPMLLIVLQPDMGTALTFIPTVMAMLFVSSNRARLIVFLASPLISLLLFPYKIAWGIYMGIFCAAIWYLGKDRGEKLFFILLNIGAGFSGSLLWDMLKDYQKNRLLVFLDPEMDPLGAGYNIIQSKIAIGSGGLWGKGFMQGTQNQLAFLPAQHTDFIFSVIGEEGGFLWGALLIFAFMVLFAFIAHNGYRCKTAAGAIFTTGVLALVGFHILINIGMSIGMMPITGIPLPLISYGGSSLFSLMFLLGTINSMAVRIHSK